MPLFGPPNIGELKRNRDVYGLIKALSYKKNLEVREQAAKALGEIKDRLAFEPLVMALQDQSMSVRMAAAKALGELKDERAFEPLVAALQDREFLVSFEAEHALKGMIKDRHAFEPLVEALENQDSNGRRAAANLLSELKDERAFEPLAAALQDRDGGVRGAAARALGYLGREFGWANAVPLLEALLNDDQAGVREEAVWSLDWISANTDLKPAVAECASRWSARLVAMHAKATDPNMLHHLSSLIELSKRFKMRLPL